MALRNYMYAKHATDQFAMKVLRQQENPADGKSQQLENKLENQNGNNEEISTQSVARDHCSEDTCNNCQNCSKTEKLVAKVSIEIEQESVESV